MIPRFEFLRDVRGKGVMVGVEFGRPRSLKLKASWHTLETTRPGLFSQLITIPRLQRRCGDAPRLFQPQARTLQDAPRRIPIKFRTSPFYMIEAKPENLIGDRAYDSDPLDEELRNDGIEMIAPHRSNRSKPPTQDRRRLSRYMRRWLVERFFAWIQWQRRILVRWEYPRPQLSRLRPARLPRCPRQAILR
jgi:transposase